MQPEGLASEFGVALKLPKALTEAELETTPQRNARRRKSQYYAHTLIEGNVEWGKEAKGTNQGDYHDYFEIHVSPALPLLTLAPDLQGTARQRRASSPTRPAVPGHNTTSTWS